MHGTSKAAGLARWLQRQITSGVWPVNTRIPIESEIAAEHGVGRSTVREATRSVVMLGMLEAVPGCGTFVRSTSPANSVLSSYFTQQPVGDVAVLRSALEAEAAALAAVRRTDEQLAALEAAAASGEAGCRRGSPFHRLLFEAAQTPLLAELYGSLPAMPARPASPTSDGASPTGIDGNAEHRRIVRAIRAGDPVKARTAAARHADRELLQEVTWRRTPATVTPHPLGRRMATAG